MRPLRKHYLDTHRTGQAVLNEIEMRRQAATNPGERIEVIDGHAVAIVGDAPPGAAARFAADVALRSLADLAA